MLLFGAHSSVVERLFYTQLVIGSNPVAPNFYSAGVVQLARAPSPALLKSLSTVFLSIFFLQLLWYLPHINIALSEDTISRRSSGLFWEVFWLLSESRSS